MMAAFSAAVSAADFSGTWKLDTAKSKYEGMPAPKDSTVTITTNGSGFDYMAMGTSASGESIHSMYTFVKDGAPIKTTGFPNWDGIVITHSADPKLDIDFMRGGKSIGKGVRDLAKDGKMYTVSGKIKLADGKSASFKAVYVKQ